MASFVQVQEILDKLVDYESIGMHGPFWRGKSRDEFVSLSIFGLPIISIGDSAESNLIKALRGLAPFGRNLDPRPLGARFNRMPSRRPPAPEEDIETIERWINLGCPESLPDHRENREALLAASTVDIDVHIRFWREFDDLFLYKSSEQTKKTSLVSSEITFRFVSILHCETAAATSGLNTLLKDLLENRSTIFPSIKAALLNLFMKAQLGLRASSIVFGNSVETCYPTILSRADLLGTR